MIDPIYPHEGLHEECLLEEHRLKEENAALRARIAELEALQLTRTKEMPTQEGWYWAYGKIVANVVLVDRPFDGGLFIGFQQLETFHSQLIASGGSWSGPLVPTPERKGEKNDG